MATSTGDTSAPAVAHAFKEYKWYNSSSLPIDVQCGICRLEFPMELKTTSSIAPQDLYITAYVVCNQMPLHESPVSTFFSRTDDIRNCYVWDYIMTFPLRMRDLSLDAILVITAWTPDGKVFGGTTMNFFDTRGLLKKGKQKLMFFFGTPGDSNCIRAQNTTPGENYNPLSKWDYRFKLEKDLEAYGCSSNGSGAGNGRAGSSSEWLDKLTFTQVQKWLDQSGKRQPAGGNSDSSIEEDGTYANFIASPEEFELSSYCFLVVDLPILQYPVRSLIRLWLMKYPICMCILLLLLLLLFLSSPCPPLLHPHIIPSSVLFCSVPCVLARR
jgi:hypothetical protein